MKKYGILALALILVLGGINVFAANDTKNSQGISELKGDMTLYVNSPLIMEGNRVLPLDSENLGVVPRVKDGRTLVPLRSVAEHLGGNVSYDENLKTAVIEKGGHTYEFPVNKKHYTIDNGAEHKIDTASQIIQGRVMVPLRVIAEDIMEKKVSYCDDIIVIGNEAYNLKNDKERCSIAKDKIGKAVKADSLTDVKKVLKSTDYDKIVYENQRALSTTSGADMAKSNSEEARNEASADMEADAGGGDYSTTNNQVEGIDESDIVKTDGEYIYIVNGETTDIIRAAQGDMEKVSSIRLKENYYIEEIFIDENRLVLMGRYHEENQAVAQDGARQKLLDNSYYYPSKSYTYVGVYDTSDKSNPTKFRELLVEGSMNTARKNGDYVYVITNSYVNYAVPLASAEAEDLLPAYRDSIEGESIKAMAVEDIMICPITEDSSFTTVAVVDIKNNDTKSRLESFLGSAQELYMNDKSLYMTFFEYADDQQKTGLIALDVDGTNLGFRSSGSVDGHLLNQFSMDEYNGYFRVAVTKWGRSSSESSSALYVLDSQLDMVGQIENIAEGEQIYAVRFMGDKGYIVTFETVDPLFTLDLSNPNQPKIAGELKVPGFSNYLHPVGENQVLGIGRDTREMFVKEKDGSETVVGIRTEGIKLSLFDVTDFNNPKELDTVTIGGQGSYSEVLYNHKALMADNKKSLFGFCAEIWDEDSDDETGAFTFEIKDGNIEQNAAIPYVEPEKTDTYSYYNRLCYIGDTLYYLQNGLIRAFDMDNMEETGQLYI